MALLLHTPSSSSLLPSKFVGVKRQNVCTNLTNSFTRFKSSWQELAGVLVFSAIPFSAVKAIANSPLGEALQRRMEERKKIEVGNSSKFKALAQKARKER